MTAVMKDRKPPVVYPSIPASLLPRRATPAEQKTWTDSERASRTCMHCKTAYKGGGDAWKCEHHHEGL